jgi:GNAT superfamily N-acetyltransferase
MAELQILRTLHPPELFISQIAFLNEEIGRRISPNFLLQKINALPHSDRLLLAVEGESLLGYAHLSVRNELAGGDPVEIVDLVVRAANRRQGIGRQLLNAAETWAQASNHSSLIARIDVPNSDVQAFLTALHFDQQGTQLTFIRSL